MRYHSHIDRDEFGRREGKRGWFYFDANERFGLTYDISNNRKYRHCGISVGRGSRSIKASLSIPYILSFYLSIKGVLPQGNRRETSLRFHGNALWWSIWKDPDDYDGRRGWREGSFHFDDFFLGKSTCTRTTLEERDILVPMPERSYPAHAKLVLYQWSRPRWFTKHMKRCEIDVPEGIPHEGKGENSWDCGQDATFGMTTGECRNIAQGVGMLVGSCLNDRVRYGGWSDWSWPIEKTEPKAGAETVPSAGSTVDLQAKIA